MSGTTTDNPAYYLCKINMLENDLGWSTTTRVAIPPLRRTTSR
jgi:hypothetical protein